MNYHQVFNDDVFPLHDKLYRFSLSIVRKNDIAEDVVQEVLIKVWDKREDWENWRNMNAMIYTMTRNLSLDKLKSKNNQLFSIPEGYDTPSDSASPVQRVISQDVERIIHNAIGTLSEIQQMVIRLRDIDGYTYQEISDLTDLTMSQVKVNLHRGRLELRDKLQNVL